MTKIWKHSETRDGPVFYSFEYRAKISSLFNHYIGRPNDKISFVKNTFSEHFTAFRVQLFINNIGNFKKVVG